MAAFSTRKGAEQCILVQYVEFYALSAKEYCVCSASPVDLSSGRSATPSEAFETFKCSVRCVCRQSAEMRLLFSHIVQATILPNPAFPTNKVPESPAAMVCFKCCHSQIMALLTSTTAVNDGSHSDCQCRGHLNIDDGGWQELLQAVCAELRRDGAARPDIATSVAHCFKSVILSSYCQRALLDLLMQLLGPSLSSEALLPSLLATSSSYLSSGCNTLSLHIKLNTAEAAAVIDIPQSSQENHNRQQPLRCSSHKCDQTLRLLVTLRTNYSSRQNSSVHSRQDYAQNHPLTHSCALETLPSTYNKYGFSRGYTGNMNRWGVPTGLGLAGGGESATANGWGNAAPPSTAGWGSQTSAVPGGSQWGSGRAGAPTSSAGVPTSSSSGIKTAPASAGTAAGGASSLQQQQSQPTAQSASNNAACVSGWSNSKSVVASDANKRHKEQLQSIRDALLSSEGWGGENVNQDTVWELPASPEPNREAPPPITKLVNNGTELWETNLRNGGAPPPKSQQAPWGHTPATNYGGTWGEDDEQSDTSNAWTGGAPPPPPGAPTPQWPPNNPAAVAVAAAAAAGGPNMWNQQKKPTDWHPGQPNWPDHSGPPRAAVDTGPDGWPHGPPKIPGHLPPHANPPVGPPGGLHGPPHINPHGIHTRAHVPHVGHHGGPPAGPHATAHHLNGPPGPGLPVAGGVWGGKELGKNNSGWGDEPGNAAGLGRGGRDDGTALWGNPQQQSNVSRWKEQQGGMNNAAVMMAAVRMQQQAPPQQQQQRMPPPHVPPQQPHPPKQPPTPGLPMWGHHGRNGNWNEPSHDAGNPAAVAAAVWGEDVAKGVAGWGPGDQTSPSWNNKAKMNPGTNPWLNSEMENLAQFKQIQRQLASAPNDINFLKYRSIIEYLQQKEEIEVALGRTGLEDLERAAAAAAAAGAADMWRSPAALDDHPAPNIAAAAGAQFPDLSAPGATNFQNHFFQSGGGAGLTPAQQQQLATSCLQGNAGIGNNNPVTNALMQTIKEAVNQGVLRRSILTMPLNENMLMLLHNLCKDFQELQRLNNQKNALLMHPSASQSSLIQLNLHINKLKAQIDSTQDLCFATARIQRQGSSAENHQYQLPLSRIAFCQNQLARQQQQQPPQVPGMSGAPHKPHPDLMSNKQPAFSDFSAAFGQLNLNDVQSLNIAGAAQSSQLPPQLQQQQGAAAAAALVQNSRGLGREWKLTSTDNDEASALDFIRAPGAGKQPNLSLITSPNSAWSQNSVSRDSSGGWPNSGDKVNSSSVLDPPSAWGNSLAQNNHSSGAAAVTTSADELNINPFEPGKPWKLKNIEDDPNVTPGSVSLNPLLSSMSKAPTTMSSELPGLSLASSTWSYNPQDVNSKAASKTNTGAWSDGSTTFSSDIWSTMNSVKASGTGSGVSSANSATGGSNRLISSSAGSSWSGLGGRSGWPSDQRAHNSALQQPSGGQGGEWAGGPSTSLILKNLTPQVDGSTLKTVCRQHGPLSNFRLALNQGFALVTYRSREEAIKAQSSLHNCVLQNTTILAEFANDQEVSQVLGSTTSGGSGSGGPPTPGATSLGWGSSSATSGNPRDSTPTSSNSRGVDTWSTGGSTANLWSNGNSTRSLWPSVLTDAGPADQSQRATPSQRDSFLPDSLLGSEGGIDGQTLVAADNRNTSLF